MICLRINTCVNTCMCSNGCTQQQSRRSTPHTDDGCQQNDALTILYRLSFSLSHFETVNGFCLYTLSPYGLSTHSIHTHTQKESNMIARAPYTYT